METEFLSLDELHQLTGRARAKAQAVWLSKEGIPHQLRDRRVFVCRVHLRRWVEQGRGSAVSFQEPDLSCVN